MNPAEPTPLDGDTLDRMEALLREETGLTLAGEVRGSLALSAGAAAAALGLPIDALVARLRAREAGAVAAFVDHAVVPETYFFRHPEQFRALATAILPALAERPSLRLWSAGCATGEEPYSLAMALFEAGRRPGADLVLGTDVSPRLLERAREGRYGRWSFRHVAPELLGRHLQAGEGPAYELAEAVRRTVTFRRHNLVAEPPALAGCDLISCRNVLIYFAPELARRVLEGLVGALRPGGWLLLGPAELPLAHGLEVDPVERAGATLLRRPEASAARPPARAGARPAVSHPRRPDRSPPPPADGRELLPREPERERSAAVGARPLAGSAARSQGPAGAAIDPRARCHEAPSAYHRAVVAAQTGRLDEALALAREAAREPAAAPHLLLALLADAAGDDEAAFTSVRRALYLDPGDPLAHATLARLHDRGGRSEEARRSRTNALEALGERSEDELIPGPVPMTVGALRQALRGS